MNKRSDRDKLLKDAGLTAGDFYVLDDKYIIRRTGMDKIEKKYPVDITIESITTVPYGAQCCTTLLGSGRLRGAGTAGTIRTVASANPDNCAFPHYAEVAYKRLRHRLLLSLIDMYELDVYSEDESEDFKQKFDSNRVLAELASKKPLRATAIDPITAT
jgi:hypothetical protein